MRIRFSRSLVMSAMLVALALVLVSAPDAEAQDSHWGVTASFVPKWTPIPEIWKQTWVPGEFRANGKEFRLGVVRGSDLGGDWSVTFVRNWFTTDETINRVNSFDLYLPPDFTRLRTVRDGSIFTFRGDIEVFGVKYEKFTPVVTIKDRVQIGLTYGIGIGSLRGTVSEQRFENFDRETSELIPHTQTVMEALSTWPPAGRVTACPATADTGFHPTSSATRCGYIIVRRSKL